MLSWYITFIQVILEVIQGKPASTVLDHITVFSAIGQSVLNPYILLALDSNVRNMVLEIIGLKSTRTSKFGTKTPKTLESRNISNDVTETPTQAMDSKVSDTRLM